MASGLGKDSEWRTSSWCEGGACVEAAAQDDAILLRSSVDPDGPVLAFTQAAWRDLIAGIRQAFLEQAQLAVRGAAGLAGRGQAGWCRGERG